MLIAAERVVICQIHVRRDDHETTQFRCRKLKSNSAVKQFDGFDSMRLLKANFLVFAFAAPAAALLFPGAASGDVFGVSKYE